MTATSKASLHGRTVVLTRPAGTARAMVKKVHALGGVPLLLPGLALRRADDPVAARAGWLQAQSDELLVFSSPAAVRFAIALAPLRTSATIMAVGLGTARALRQQGIAAPLVPSRQDSEGLLAHPALQHLAGRRIALVGASGGRGLLRETLTQRGALLRQVHVYRRVPPRLDRRHVEALLQLAPSARVLLSSAEALRHLQDRLPPHAWQRLCSATAVASSERLAMAAQAAGFGRVVRAESALAADLLAAAARAD
jgi:uroporphyrinogen-III synthase